MPVRPLPLHITLLLTSMCLPAAAADPPSPPGSAPSKAPPASYQLITGEERAKWAVKTTIGPQSLAAGLFSSAISTAANSPEEYGTHWDGYGKRYGLRLTGVATSNLMEAGLGAIWGEDPRYFRAADGPVGDRIRHIVKYTFFARDRDGNDRLAYARLAAIPGSNVISNAWRPDSTTGASDVLIRTGLGFAGRMGGNAFMEFWPDVTRRLFHRNQKN